MDSIEAVEVFMIDVDKIERREFEELDKEQLLNLKDVFHYSLADFELMLNDEVYPTNQWVRFIQPKPLEIDISEEDINDLSSGNDFEWTYNGIGIHIFPSEYED